MKKYLPISAAVVLFLSLGFSHVSSVSAQSPRRFYDWSTTLEAPKGVKVLGTQTFGQMSTDSAKQASSSANTSNLYQFDKYVFGGNLSADNPFHFIKNFQENVQLTFTFDPKKKDEMRLAIAGERLIEAQKLVEEGKTSGFSGISDSYRQNMLAIAADLQNLKNKNQNIDDLVKTVELETAKHNIVLENVEASVPNIAKAGLAKAIEASEENIDKVADLTNKPAVPPDVVTRITALKAQGLLTEEEAAKLINSKSRTEARGELRKYVSEGVIPESDFIRMNENVKTYFPQDFYQIHEVKRFNTMKKLEQNKPDEATLGRIQEFAKTYKPGEIVPPDVRKYWGPIIQLDEIQTTLRPDLIDPKLFKNNVEDYKKFNEIVERYKPRPEDVAFLQNYISKNNSNISTLPPEYQRMYNMGQTYGAVCGSGQKWFKSPGGEGGYCAQEGSSQDTQSFNNQNFSYGNCRGNIVSARNSTGACSAYPSDCVPAGWTKVDTCVQTPEGTGNKNLAAGGSRTGVSCPSNAHFVSVPFDPAGGYCVPNYTPTGEEYARDAKAGNPDSYCPVGYHRNYPGGPCLQDLSYNAGSYNFSGSNQSGGGYSLPPLTSNPGNYPNPYFPSSNKCGNGTHWVPEPINPSGGYCAPDNYQPSSNTGVSSTYPGGNMMSRENQEATCKAEGGSCDWDNGICNCKGYKGSGLTPAGNSSSCQPPSSGCGNNKFWDYGSCVCRENSSYPSACTYPANGCSANKFWDSQTCSCKDSSSGTNYNSSGGSSGNMMSRDNQEATCKSGGGSCEWNNGVCNCRGYKGSTSCQPPSAGCGSNSWYDYGSCSCKSSSSSSGSYTPPPSGYGGCGSGLYWNGSACISSGNSNGFSGGSSGSSGGTQSPEEACKRTSGCNWTGSSCQCGGSSSGSSNPPPQNNPQPTSPPSNNPPPNNPPPPNNSPSQNNPPPPNNSPPQNNPPPPNNPPPNNPQPPEGNPPPPSQ